MKYIKIQNDGELDIRLVALMGGTTKASDKFKIGEFGTGLKYALAYLLRENILFRIFCGDQEAKIGVELEEIQGQEFNIITINGEKTSITSNMGKDWKAWMIIREIYCNALDEGGEILETIEADHMDLKGEPGKTTFYLQNVAGIQHTVENWKKYFVQGAVPMFETGDFAIYANNGTGVRVYKQGVLIKEGSDSTPSVFDYDIKNAKLNELREYVGFFSADIASVITRLDKKTITYLLENMTEKHFEAGVDLDWSSKEFVQEWKETIGTAKLITQKSLDSLKSRGVDLDKDALLIVPENFYQQLNKQFEGIGALRKADKVNEFYEVYDPELEARIKSGLQILEDLGISAPSLTWVTGVFGDKNVLARIRVDSETVFVNTEILKRSKFDFLATLLEEIEHFHTGFDDCTRAFQQHFINLYLQAKLKEGGMDI